VKRPVLALAAALTVAAATLLQAQQNLNDLDGDGVPNLLDRCPNTPRGTRVDANGCPVTGAAAPARPAAPGRADTARAPAGGRVKQPPAGQVQRRDSAPAVAAPAVAPAGAAVPAVVTPQAATPAAAPAAGGAFTAGMAMTPFSGGGAAARNEYLRRLSQMLDSSVVLLVAVFRNTSGQPLGGATRPEALSQRERDRWLRCRSLHWDLTTYHDALSGVLDSIPAEAAAVRRAAAALDTALTELDATGECDNVASMIEAPGRWEPWQDQYRAVATRFYRDWYTQLRNVHEKDRALVIALNTVLAAARRLPVPPGLPRNPPYAGAGPQ
jgi:hypothetical protein